MNLPQDFDKRSGREQVKLENESLLLFQLLKCANFIEREINNILRPFGLKQQQFAVLNEIVLRGPISQKELVDNLLYEKSNISKIVKILSERKLIQITVAPADRRLTLLLETSEGSRQWQSCMREFNHASSMYVSYFSGGQLEKALKIMKYMGKNLAAKRKNSS